MAICNSYVSLPEGKLLEGKSTEIEKKSRPIHMESGSRRQALKAAEGVMPQMRREIHGAADDVDADIAPGQLPTLGPKDLEEIFREKPENMVISMGF